LSIFLKLVSGEIKLCLQCLCKERA
jgi:hypothetical protein